jgi:hypothetical protein
MSTIRIYEVCNKIPRGLFYVRSEMRYNIGKKYFIVHAKVNAKAVEVSKETFRRTEADQIIYKVTNTGKHIHVGSIF